MICYVIILVVFVRLVCVCVYRHIGQGLMVIVYAITCYAYMNCMWARPTIRVWVGPVIHIGRGLLCKFGRGPLYSLGEARYMSLGGAHYTH